MKLTHNLRRYLEKYFKQIFAIDLIIIISSSIATFMFLENQTLLDSIYFVVVTISTVGFGDVIVTNDFTKIIVIILILNGIISIAVASQLIFQRIIQYQLTKYSFLPKDPLEYDGHIIIAGYGAKGRKVAELLRDRLFTIVIVEMDDERAKLAELNGYILINGDITKPSVLNILSLENASGLFLMLSDDNLTMQTGILARSIANEIHIYAEISSLATYNVAKYAGIDKPISLVNFLANNVQGHLNHYEVQPIFTKKDLIRHEASIGIVQVHEDNDTLIPEHNALLLGNYSNGLNEFHPLYSKLDFTHSLPPLNCNHHLFIMKRDDFINLDKTSPSIASIPHKRIIFAGYSELVETILHRLDLTDEHEIIVLSEKDNYARDENTDYRIIEWKIEQAYDLLDNLVKPDDLIIGSFDGITNSLFLAVTLRNLQRNTHLIQIVPYQFDIEPFVKVGAEVVLTPQLIIANAMITTFLQDTQLPPSMVFSNGHLFEHIVKKEDWFIRKTAKSVIEKGFDIQYIIKKNQDTIGRINSRHIIKESDRLVIWISHEK